MKSGEVSETQTEKPGIIAYYGDMKAVAPETNDDSTTKIFLNLGGIAGYVKGGNENGSATISNVLFDGTIGFDNSLYADSEDLQNKLKHLYLCEGGVIGKTEGSNITVKNTIAAGEILLSNKYGKKFELIDNQMFVAGLIGYNNATTTLGTIGTDGEMVYVITTLFSLTGSNGVDSITHNANGYKLTLNNEVRYCSSLNLVVSDLKNDDDYTIPEDAKKANLDDLLNNVEYSSINALSGQDAKTDSIWNARGNTVKGSKLEPYNINDLKIGEDITEKESASDSENEYIVVKTKSKASGKGEIINYISTYTRKMYISVESNLSLPNQISLKNTILFSQGALLKSTITPINTISADSAVSGLVVKLFVDESDGSAVTTKYKYVNLGGLANRNDGIIYTCSVQEILNDPALSSSTQFYGVMNPEVNKNLLDSVTQDVEGKVFDTETLPRGIAGFVANNTGYIFGSNANVNMYVNMNNNTVMASNFVITNTGVISYCYATGVNNRDGGYLFIADPTDARTAVGITSNSYGTIENCYTIAKAINGQVNSYIPNKCYEYKDDNNETHTAYPVYVESDASEIDFKANGYDYQDIKLYKARPENNDGPFESALIVADTKGYYDCDPYCNYNYPTLSGGLFKNFTFLKRSTMVEYDSKNEIYTERNRKIYYNGTTYENYNNVIGYNYFRDILYSQIPNLTVLKDLNSSGDNESLISEYSKFLIISNMNFGYNLSKNEKIKKSGSQTSILGTIAPITQLYDRTGLIDKYADVVIDCQNSIFSNLLLDKGYNLIDDITNFVNQSTRANTITIKNLKFKEVSLDGVIGLINHTSSCAVLDTIAFEDDSCVMINTENYVYDLDNDDCYDLYESDGFYKNVIGVLVGKNEGKITNSQFVSKIRTSGEAKGSYALGGFAGQNSGEIKDCKFNGNVYISEKFATKKYKDLQVVFGGIAAINKTVVNNGNENGAVISKSILDAGHITNYILTADGELINKVDYDAKEKKVKDADEEAKGGKANAADYQLNAQIYVVTNNKAVVGGIVGILESGQVEQSLTYKNSSDNEFAILVGDEYIQRVSYAGGIAGIMKNSGTIQDCSNRSNISTMAVWLLTTNSKSKANFEITADTQTVKKCYSGNNQREYDSFISKYGDQVYFDGEDSSVFVPKLKLDNDSENFYDKLYVYRDMISLAYAGGIAGLGISNVETVATEQTGNNRLANYGNISGGFRARKPAAIIYNSGLNINVLNNRMSAFPWLAVATYGSVAGAVIGVGLLAGGTLLMKAGGLGLIAAYIAAHLEYVFNLESMYESLTNLTLKVEGFVGSSAKYHRDNNFVQNLFNDDSKWGEKAISVMNTALKVQNFADRGLSNKFKISILFNIIDVVSSLQGYVDYTDLGDFIYDSDSLWSAYADFIVHNKLILGSEPILYLSNVLANVLGDPLEIPEMAGLVSLKSSDDLTKIYSASTIDNSINCYKVNDITEYNSELKSYSYDGICPSLIGINSSGLQVYSKTSNYKIPEDNEIPEDNDILATLNSSNPDNRFIQFKVGEIGENNKTYTFKDNYSEDNNIGISSESQIDTVWDTEKHPWIKSDDGLFVPEVDSEKTVETSENPEDADKIVKINDKYSFRLTDINNWPRLVKTINNNAEYRNMDIIISLGKNQTKIPVNKSILNEFNGSITFRNPNYRFTNLVLSDNAENKGVGLIRKTKGVTLVSVSVEGSVSFTISDKKDKSGNLLTGLNAGILIGQVEPESKDNILLISTSKIVASSITITETGLKRINNWGGLIGSLTIGAKQATADEVSEDESENGIIYQSMLNNITLGSTSSVESPFNINAQAINISEDTNKYFGGLIGSVSIASDKFNNADLDNLVINKVSSYGTVKLVSEFNYVGGLIGNISPEAKVQLGNTLKLGETGDENIIQLNVGAAANANTFVGGIIGNNQGSVSVLAPLNIGTQTGITISSDIINENKSAFAGGLVGNNGGGIAGVNIFMGKDTLTSFESISYVFAGYNGMNLESKTAIPKNAYAGLTAGNGNGVSVFASFSFITKYMYNSNTKNYSTNTQQAKSPTWNDIYKDLIIRQENGVWGVYFDGQGTKYNVFNTEIENGINYLVLNEKIQLTIPENIDTKDDDGNSFYKKTTLTYQYAPVNENGEIGEKQDLETDGVASESTMKMGYKITPITYKDFTTSNDGDVINYQWKLEINYKKQEKQYSISTTDADVTYEYIISLVGSNARIEDSGRYNLIIKQLTNCTVNKKLIGYVYVTRHTDTNIKVDGVDDAESIETVVPIIEEVYEGYDDEKVVMSKTFNINNFDTNKASENLISELKLEMNADMDRLFTESKKSNITATSTSGSIEQADLETSLKNDTMGFYINYNNSNKKFSLEIKDKYTLDINYKYQKGTINLDLNGSRDKIEISDSKSLSRSILLIDDISTGDLATEECIDTNGLFVNTYTVMFNGRTIAESINFTEDVKLFDKGINYQDTTFKYLDSDVDEYSNIKLYKYSNKDKDAQYVIVSFMKGKDENSTALLLREYVYMLNNSNDSNPFDYLGYISYALKDIPNGKTAFEIYNELYDNNGPDRHESYFPTLIDSDNKNYNQAISEVSNNIFKKAEKKETIQFECYYVDHQINVETEKDSLYYKYTDNIRSMKRTFKLGGDFIFKTKDTLRYSQDPTPITERFDEKPALNGFLKTEQKNGSNLTWQSSAGKPIEFNGIDEGSETEKIVSIKYGVWKGTVIAVHINKIVTEYDPELDEKGNVKTDKDGNIIYLPKQVPYEYYYYVTSGIYVEVTPYENMSSIIFYVATGDCDESKM